MLSLRILINVLEHSSILGILVIGMIFCLLAGRFDLSSESTLGFSAIVGAWLVSTNVHFGSGWLWPPVAVVLLMLAMGAAGGCINSFFIIKLRVNAFIVTLAMLLALRGFTYVFTNANTMYDFPDSFMALGGYSISGMLPVSVILFLGLFLFSQFVLSYTRFGRDLYAIGGNRAAAFAAGIRVDRQTFAAFVISGMLGGLAGWVLAGRLQAVTIGLGEGMVFEVFAAAVHRPSRQTGQAVTHRVRPVLAGTTTQPPCTARVRGQAAQLYQAHQVESATERVSYCMVIAQNQRKQCGYGRPRGGYKQKLDRWRLQQIHILLPELGNPACKLNYVLPMGDEPSLVQVSMVQAAQRNS